MTAFRIPNVSRRRFLEGAVALSGALALRPLGVRAAGGFATPAATQSAIAKSPLIYVSPLQSDGRESACQAEVWFVPDAGDLLVVTASDRWRARAISQNLDRARIWVGDFGVWKKSGGKFKRAPTLLAEASILPKSDPTVERALHTFGSKYPDEWDKWGPRFRDGLNDGSRVLIRYRPIAA